MQILKNDWVLRNAPKPVALQTDFILQPICAQYILEWLVCIYDCPRLIMLGVHPDGDGVEPRIAGMVRGTLPGYCVVVLTNASERLCAGYLLQMLCYIVDSMEYQ